MRADDDLVSEVRWGASRSRFGWNLRAQAEETALLEGVRNADLGVGEGKLGTLPKKSSAMIPGRDCLEGRPKVPRLYWGALIAWRGRI